MPLLIKNGEILTADSRTRADIFAENETITRIGRDLEAPPGAEIIDATGKYVFPGFIDPHVHIYLPFMATFAKDTHETASVAALIGGTTTYIEMCCPSRADDALEHLADLVASPEEHLGMLARVPGQRRQERVFGQVALRQRREAEQRVARRLGQAPFARELGALADLQVPRQPIRLAGLKAGEVARRLATDDCHSRRGLVERPPDRRAGPECPVEPRREFDGRRIVDRL